MRDNICVLASTTSNQVASNDFAFIDLWELLGTASLCKRIEVIIQLTVAPIWNAPRAIQVDDTTVIITVTTASSAPRRHKECRFRVVAYPFFVSSSPKKSQNKG